MEHRICRKFVTGLSAFVRRGSNKSASAPYLESMIERRTTVPSLLLAALLASGTAGAAEPSDQGPYAPYAFLIGQWDVVPESGGPAVARSVLRWGPKRSYIWYETSLMQGETETPHFEGMLVWNPLRKNLDMLLTLDLEGGGRMQEQGTVSIGADGTVVREITAYSAGVAGSGSTGTIGHFRQTFKASGPDRIRTSVLRKSGQGYVATFPGSDRLAMIRRKEA